METPPGPGHSALRSSGHASGAATPATPSPDRACPTPPAAARRRARPRHGTLIESRVEAGDRPIDVLGKIINSDAEALRDIGSTIDAEQSDSAVDALHGAERILLVGVGTSAPLDDLRHGGGIRKPSCQSSLARTSVKARIAASSRL
ncbi:hypothetical protein GCM10010208_34290 [Actinomadura livida]|nr:hypothetical protein GCM10010208_34290 [Actinomadura livida]